WKYRRSRTCSSQELLDRRDQTEKNAGEKNDLSRIATSRESTIHRLIALAEGAAAVRLEAFAFFLLSTFTQEPGSHHLERLGNVRRAVRRGSIFKRPSVSSWPAPSSPQSAPGWRPCRRPANGAEPVGIIPATALLSPRL